MTSVDPHSLRAYPDAPPVAIPRSKSTRTGGGFFIRATPAGFKSKLLKPSKASKASDPTPRLTPSDEGSQLGTPNGRNNGQNAGHRRSQSDQIYPTERDSETQKDVKLLTSLILKLKQVQDHEAHGEPNPSDHWSMQHNSLIENEPLSPLSPTGNIFSFKSLYNDDSDDPLDPDNELDSALGDTYHNTNNTDIATLKRHNISPTTWNRAVKTRAFLELYYHSLSRHQASTTDHNQTMPGVYNPLQIIRNRKIRSRQSFHFVEPIEVDPSLMASSIFTSKRNRKLIWEIPVFELLGDISWRSGNRRLMKNRKGEYIYPDINKTNEPREPLYSVVGPSGITASANVPNGSVESNKSKINGSIKRLASSAQLSILGKSSSETEDTKESVKMGALSDSSDNEHTTQSPYKARLLSKLANPKMSSSESELYRTPPSVVNKLLPTATAPYSHSTSELAPLSKTSAQQEQEQLEEQQRQEEQQERQQRQQQLLTASHRLINRLINELTYCETVLILSWMHFSRRSQKDYRSQLVATTVQVTDELQSLTEYVNSITPCSLITPNELKTIKYELEYDKSRTLDSALFASDRIVTEISTSLNLEAKRVCEALDRLECSYMNSFAVWGMACPLISASSGQGSSSGGRKSMYCALDWLLRLIIWSVWALVQMFKLIRGVAWKVEEVCIWSFEMLEDRKIAAGQDTNKEVCEIEKKKRQHPAPL